MTILLHAEEQVRATSTPHFILAGCSTRLTYTPANKPQASTTMSSAISRITGLAFSPKTLDQFAGRSCDSRSPRSSTCSVVALALSPAYNGVIRSVQPKITKWKSPENDISESCCRKRSLKVPARVAPRVPPPFNQKFRHQVLASDHYQQGSVLR